jgi:hypothetical protein
MAFSPRLIASLALPWALLIPACGGTSDDSLFSGQARGPSAESADVDAGSPSNPALDGTGGSDALEGDPPVAGGAGGAPDRSNPTAGGGTGGDPPGAKGRGTGGATGTGGSTSSSALDAGPPCTAIRFYLDADGDGFGDPKRFSDACDKPSGHVTNAADCYDANAQAHPGQTTLFDVERGDGSFDYDCDGKGTPADATVGHCGTFPFCSGAPGWKTASPACGASEVWLDSCTGLTTICAQKTETRVQSCL